MTSQNNWFEYIRNPHSYTVKKYLFEVMGAERYVKHDKYLDRIVSHMLTQDDVDSFGKLIVDIFEAGFMKAFNESREQFKKLGYNVGIKPEEKKSESKPIFPQE
jgi:hypothetical protein